MAARSKDRPVSQDKRPANSAAKPSATSSDPFFRFYHSAALRKKTLAVLSTLENAKNATVHRNALVDVVIELTNCGMNYYFMKPLKSAEPGFIVLQSANLGLAGTQQVMGSVIRNIIGRMDRTQLLSVCGSIRQFML